MTKTITLKQLDAIFNNFADRHLQIKDYFFGEIYDMNAVEVKFKYPLFAVIPGNIVYKGNGEQYTLIEYTFTAIVGDWVGQDNFNETEVRSDASQILGDFLNEFGQEFYNENDITLNSDATLIPFNERLDDVITGYAMQFTITTPFRSTWCDAPMDVKELSKIICNGN